MRQTISSAQTFFMKFVFPAFWIGLFGLGTGAMWFDAFRDQKGVPPPEFVKWAFLAAWFVGSGAILWFSCRIKRVEVDYKTLYVSNYWSEVRIPLSQVSHITQSYLSRTPTITIHLRSMSPVGQRVVFIRKFNWGVFGTHPTIVELQALCERANARGGASQAKVTFDSRDAFGMRFVQVACILLCLMCILLAVTGIRSIVVTDRVVITRDTDLGRVYSILAAALYAAAFYGIHRRAPIAWKLGWVVLAGSFVIIVASALQGVQRPPQPASSINIFYLVGGTVVIALWGLWWKKQRDYFTPQQIRDTEKDGDC